MMYTITNIRKMWKHDFIIESQNFCHTITKNLNTNINTSASTRTNINKNLTKTGQLFTRPFVSGYLTESNIYYIGLF